MLFLRGTLCVICSTLHLLGFSAPALASHFDELSVVHLQLEAVNLQEGRSRQECSAEPHDRALLAAFSRCYCDLSVLDSCTEAANTRGRGARGVKHKLGAVV